MNVMPTCCCSAFSSICSAFRSFASSAPSGSSSSSTAGFSTSARASATRCCWPPDICAGLRRSRPVSCTSSSASPTRCLISFLGVFWRRRPKATLSCTRQVREQRVALEHRVDVALVRRRERHVLAVQQDLAAGRLLEAGDHPQRRRLAAARTGPASRRTRRAGICRLMPSTAVTSPNCLTRSDELDFTTGHAHASSCVRGCKSVLSTGPTFRTRRRRRSPMPGACSPRVKKRNTSTPGHHR